MAEENNVSGKTREMSRAAVESNRNIRNEVRDIVVGTLVERHLDTDNVKRVIEAVLEGAMEGAPEGETELLEALKETVDGLDEGLAKAAEASKLAIEEASSRVDEFSENDIKRALNDLNDLEGLFTEAVADFAKAGKATTKGALNDLVTHTGRTGTATGKSVADALGALQGPLSRTEHLRLSDVEKATRAGVATIASIASGILDGIADSIRHEKKPDTESEGEADKKE